MSPRVEVIGDATRITAIYALCESGTWEPRYIGKTVQYLHERHKAHIRTANARPRLPVHWWLRKQKVAVIKLLEYVSPNDDWADRERYWIAKCKLDGARLLNMTDGGEGLPGHVFTAEHKEKISEALKTGANGHCLECGEVFWRKANQIRRGHNKFCSRNCANRHNRGGKRGA